MNMLYKSCVRLILKFLLLIIGLSGCRIEAFRKDSTLTGPQVQALYDKERILTMSIEMEQSEFDRMAGENRFTRESLSPTEVWNRAMEYFYGTKPYPDYYNWYNADVTVDGRELKVVGIRQKGFLGSVLWPVPGLKVRTDKNIAGQSIGGKKFFTLNNASGDWIRFQTCLTYELFAAADYPAPRCNLAAVDLNGKPFAISVHVEAINESFLRRCFGNDSGSLYEGMVSFFDKPYLARFEPKTDFTDPKKRELIGLMEALDSPDNELIQNVSKYLNIDRFITFWALEMISNHIDGYSGNQNNFYIYFDPGDQNRGIFIPWGVDMTFTSHEDNPLFSSYHYLRGRIPGRLAGIPHMRQKMIKEVHRILDDVWNTDTILKSIADYEKLVLDNFKYYTQPVKPEKTEDNSAGMAGEVQKLLMNQPDKISEEDYKEKVAVLRRFVMEQKEQVITKLEPMFDLSGDVLRFTEETGLDEKKFSLFGEVRWEKLEDENLFRDSEWLKELIARVNHDREAAARGTGEAEAETEGWRRVTLPDHTFALELPADWEDAPKRFLYDAMAPNKVSGLSISQWQGGSLVDSLAFWTQELEIIEEKKVSFHEGVDSQYVEFKTLLGGAKIHFIGFTIEKSNSSYSVNLWNIDQYSEFDKDLFVEITRKFRFLSESEISKISADNAGKAKIAAKASPLDWLIAVILVSDDRPYIILIMGSLILLLIISVLRRKI